MTLVVAAGAAALPATAANARSYPGAAPEDPSLVEADVPGLDRGDGSPKPSASPEGVPAAVGVRLLDAPVNRRDDTRAHKYIVDHVHPGTTIRRRIVVENVSPVKRLVDVYPAAADVTEKGFVLAPDRTQNELSSWIEVDKTQVKLGSDDEATVWVTIRVPKKAEAGERYAVVWAQSTSGNDRMVEQIARAGIRVYLSVGPGGEPPSGFEVGPLSGGREADGTPFVTTRYATPANARSTWPANCGSPTGRADSRPVRCGPRPGRCRSQGGRPYGSSWTGSCPTARGRPGWIWPAAGRSGRPPARSTSARPRPRPRPRRRSSTPGHWCSARAWSAHC
ncbi:hypothetical protein JNW90_18540 [Micromonospora sp. STR1s_5]|nr:hypothetical protein [Micromonospora sp. STR1s_5]